MNSRRSAFTLVELAIVAGILGILLVFLLPALAGKSGHKPPRIRCVMNLKNVGIAFRIYATDNNDLFPGQRLKSGELQIGGAPDPLTYFLPLTNELSSPRLLICPADRRKVAADWKSISRANLSYFYSPDARETYPQSFLAGDRNLTTNGTRLSSGLVRLLSDAKLDWDNTIHKKQGNVCMSDGHVEQLSPARLREQFRNTELTNFNLVIP